MTTVNIPTVRPERLFPKGRHPAGAAVKCPHCEERHWYAISAASNVHHCTKTSAPFYLDWSRDAE